MSTNIRYSDAEAEADEIAATIHLQIKAATFMTLGAEHLVRRVDAQHPTFSFVARIIPTGKRSPRKMTVDIEYLPSDLYRITVWYLDRQGNRITHYQVSDVHNGELNRELFALDREG